MKQLILISSFLVSFVTIGQGWLPRADFGGIGRHRCTGMSIGNKGYAGLGHMNGTGVNIVYQDWWEYDPASNSWTQKANYPAPMYGAIAWGNSTKGYVGGGTAYSVQYFAFDPDANTWTPIANCPLDATDQTSFSINEKGYVIMGNQIAEYNPATDTWSMKANLPASLNTWQSSFVIGSSAFVKNGTMLYEFKPSQNVWMMRANFPGLASGGSSACTINGKGYIVTGYSGWLSNVTDEVWEYNPANNTWQQMEDFPGSARRFSVGFSVNERAYFGLGTNGINFNDFWAFDRFAGINENDLLAFEVYPNPATDQLTIATKSDQKLNFELVDQLGRIVQSGIMEAVQTTISVTDLEPGTYMLVLRDASGNTNQQTLIKR
jgi:N-acetylneuraminic acid mutarotase